MAEAPTKAEPPHPISVPPELPVLLRRKASGSADVPHLSPRPLPALPPTSWRLTVPFPNGHLALVSPCRQMKTKPPEVLSWQSWVGFVFCSSGVSSLHSFGCVATELLGEPIESLCFMDLHEKTS